jgi:hypothetical protein
MKTTKMIILVLLILIGNQLHAQKLYESLGGAKTDFTFISFNIDLTVMDQFIIKKGGIWYDNVYEYGGGYESLHLEFSTEKELFTVLVKRQISHYKLSFYDQENKLITTLNFFNDMSRRENKITVLETDGMTFFSVDLIGIPFSMLEATRKIDIVKYERD